MKSGGLRLKNKKKQSLPGKPLVSIITVVYNGENYLEQTIQSVLAQDYTNIEYIIIDGGSKDRTIDIIKKYENCIDFWISEKDSGITNAFNKGISYATGDLIGILNADDWFEAGCVTTVVQNYTPGKIIHGNMKIWTTTQQFEIARPDHGLLLKEMTVNHPTVFVPMALYQKFGFFDEDFKLSMDYELLLRMVKKGAEIKYVDSVLANMRMGGASSNWLQCYRETKKAKDKNLGKSIAHARFYYWQVLRRVISESLQELGFTSILDYYRKHFSVIKKERYMSPK